VNVLNTPLPVTVTNPTVPPSTVNVGNPAAIAAAIAQAPAPRGTPVVFDIGVIAGVDQYLVPVGKLLMIEYVSGKCLPLPALPGETFDEYENPGIHFNTGGVLSEHLFVISGPASSSIKFVNKERSFSHLVKIYADAGTTVSPYGTLFCGYRLSGQLITP
jgi:hypothetical protein